MLLPQIFEARSARLARLAMSRSAVSGAQWFALIALIVSALVVLALIYNEHSGTQVLAINVCSVAAAVAFFVVWHTITPSSASYRSARNPCWR